MEKIKKCPDENEEYTVTEIIEELMQDMSWEADPMYRMRALGFIKSEIFTAS